MIIVDRGEIVVVAWAEECGSILSNLIMLLLQLELLDKFLHVCHLSRASEDALIIEFDDTTRIKLFHHTSVRDVSIGCNHDSISILESHDTGSNVDGAL